MATVHVTAVTEGWPVQLDGSALTTIDMTVGGKYVRMGYHTEDITSSADVEAKLTADADTLNDAEKQHEGAFPAPTGGTDKPDYVPDDFDV